MKTCHCGKIIPKGHGLKKNRIYCCYECLKAKPPKVLELEELLEKPIRELILEMEGMRNSLENKAALLGVTRQTYCKWRVKYLESEVTNE